VLDCLALTEAVKQMPFVDRESVILFGGSGGGSLALETAASTSLAAIVCGEPATLLFCGMLGDGQFDDRGNVLRDPQQHYTPERKARTQEKIKKIKCPVLILHGDKHALRTLNLEIFLPELKAAGVAVELKLYPGNPHGFYWGGGTTEKTVEQFMADVDVFLKRCLKTPPKSMVP
jgi:acetyl esterase/lipase